MLHKDWLPLNEYSAKYRVSLSTLRRRVRASEVEYRFDEGKYWLADRPLSRPAHSVEQKPFAKTTPFDGVELDAPEIAAPAKNLAPREFAAASGNAEVLLHSAQSLLQELKNAYVKVLHEKEEQIGHLKEEVVDLKTLVKILESENERLKSNLTEAAPIDAWLEKNMDRET